MRDHLLLILGIASIGATLGYMVGGSATPVVAVALPAVFGLVAIAMGLMQTTRPSPELLRAIKALGERAGSVPEIAEFRDRIRKAPNRIGAALIAFSLSYLGAATLGAWLRVAAVNHARQVAIALPWSGQDVQPPTMAAALQWLALKHRFQQLDYSEAAIGELYQLQVNEWKRTGSGTPLPETARPCYLPPRFMTLPSSEIENQDQLWNQFSEPKDGGAAPFAIHPSRREWMTPLSPWFLPPEEKFG